MRTQLPTYISCTPQQAVRAGSTTLISVVKHLSLSLVLCQEEIQAQALPTQIGKDCDGARGSLQFNNAPLCPANKNIKGSSIGKHCILNCCVGSTGRPTRAPSRAKSLLHTACARAGCHVPHLSPEDTGICLLPGKLVDLIG